MDQLTVANSKDRSQVLQFRVFVGRKSNVDRGRCQNGGGSSFCQKFVDQTESVYGKALDKQFERLRVGMYLDKKKH